MRLDGIRLLRRPPPRACGGEGLGVGGSAARRNLASDRRLAFRPPIPAFPTASGGKEMGLSPGTAKRHTSTRN
jgi:hypothetical protein